MNTEQAEGVTTLEATVLEVYIYYNKSSIEQYCNDRILSP